MAAAEVERIDSAPAPLVAAQLMGELVMSMNIGYVDRAVRFVIGLLLLALVVLVPTHARWFGLVGLIPLITAVMGTCPVYTLLGISTLKPDEHPVL